MRQAGLQPELLINRSAAPTGAKSAGETTRAKTSDSPFFAEQRYDDPCPAVLTGGKHCDSGRNGDHRLRRFRNGSVAERAADCNPPTCRGNRQNCDRSPAGMDSKPNCKPGLAEPENRPTNRVDHPPILRLYGRECRYRRRCVVRILRSVN